MSQPQDTLSEPKSDSFLFRPNVFHPSVRKGTFVAVGNCAKTTVMLVPVIVIMLLLIFGSEWNPTRYIHQVPAVIVNLDQEKYGDLVTREITKQIPFKWRILESIESPEYYITSGKEWILIIIPSNLTLSINATLFNGEKYREQYISEYYDEGRHYYAHLTLQGIIGQVWLNVHKMVLKEVLSEANGTLDNLILTDTLTLEKHNLHPVTVPGLGAATNLGYIVVFILSMNIAGGIMATWGPLTKKVSIWQLILFRITMNIIIGFFLSLALSIIILSFGTKFYYGFGAYWMFNWLVFVTFTSMNEIQMLLFGDFAGITMTIFFFMNIPSGTATQPLSLQNYYYWIGWALPKYHAVTGARNILFGSYSMIGLNIGILFVWVLVSQLFSSIVLILQSSQVLENISVKSLLFGRQLNSQQNDEEKQLEDIEKNKSPSI
jgi:hypothetical protein